MAVLTERLAMSLLLRSGGWVRQALDQALLGIGEKRDRNAAIG
jgi:hypothetical protein